MVKAKSKAKAKTKVKSKAKPKTSTTSAVGKKKPGFPPYVCPVSSPEFLQHAVPYTFDLTLQPVKKFSSGGFGWTSYEVKRIEADGPDSTALDDKVVLANTTCNANVLGSRPGQDSCTLKAASFSKEAKPLKLKLEGEAYEFSTGSFGWQANKKIKHNIGGMDLSVQVNLNSVVRGSKPKQDPSEASDPVLARLGPQLLRKASWDIIGKAAVKDKDDLKVVKGIGPFIEKRLNKIELYTFDQLSKMTPAIEKDVTKAIVYFPGRNRRDDWVGQASMLKLKKKKKA